MCEQNSRILKGIGNKYPRKSWAPFSFSCAELLFILNAFSNHLNLHASGSPLMGLHVFIRCEK